MKTSSLFRRICWTNLVFLIFVHGVGIGGTALYVAWHGMTAAAVGLFLIYLFACGFSITSGYHRLFAHGTYRAHPAVRAFYLVFGAAVFENSALKWSSDHRRHHAYVDEADDPYNIRKGFWWAHIGWVFFNEPVNPPGGHVGDLERDPLVRLQHRFYVPLAIAVGFALPLGIGWLLNDPWGCLIMAGFLRMVVLYHATFFVNSLAHTLGSQNYSNADSSRDSALTALVTLGEGYHNFHHTFPYDYRNGVRAWQLDPTKWLIGGLHFTGLATDLVRTPDHVILKARLAMQEHRARERWADRPQWIENLAAVRKNLEALLDRWAALKARFSELKSRVDRASREALESLRLEIREMRRQFREAYRSWRGALHRPELLATLS